MAAGLLYLIFSLALLLASCCNAQFGMPGMPGMDEQKAPAVTSDIKYIRCATCEAMTKQASRQVKSMRDALKPGQKLDEGAIIDQLERMCDTSKPEGKWISHYDIVEKGERLELVDKKEPSRCNSECATIARACSQVSDDLDLSDLSEALFAGKSRSVLHQLACYEQSNACKVKPPAVPKDRKPGPAHVPLLADEAQREQMMASMKAAGLGGQMFSKDDLKQQMDQLQEQAGEGAFPEVALHEAGGKPTSGLAGQVAKAAETVKDTVGFLKGKLDQLAGSFRKPAADAGGADGGAEL